MNSVLFQLVLLSISLPFNCSEINKERNRDSIFA